ncbi:WCX domain-containing protein [Methylomonas rapida]|uniref:WYL domain-containing protein n=1 Tax=Methylomonas rapida TaxID=2963939 RepID=UPI0038B3DF22
MALILQESHLNESQTVSDADGSGFRMLTAEVLDTWQLRWWIMGEVDRVEVLLPIELRQDIQGMLARAHAQYL